MQTRFPFVEVSLKQHAFTGQPDKGTRIYRAEGTMEDIRAWFESITDAFGVMVSPGGVTMFAPVSRAAVYKRLKQGNLTGFAFHIVKKSTSIFGRPRVHRESPYFYVPVSECRAWGDLLKSQADEQIAVAEATAKDLDPSFLQYKRRK